LLLLLFFWSRFVLFALHGSQFYDSLCVRVCGTWCDFRFRLAHMYMCVLCVCVLGVWVCFVIRTNPLVNLNWMSSKAKMSLHTETVQLITDALATCDWRRLTKSAEPKAELMRGMVKKFRKR